MKETTICYKHSKTSILSVTMTTRRLDSDSEVTIVNCRQHGDYTVTGGSVTVLPAVSNSDFTVPVQLLYCHCA